MSQFSAAGVAPNGTPVRVLFGWDHAMGLWADVYDPSLGEDDPFVEYHPQNIDELKWVLTKYNVQALLANAEHIDMWPKNERQDWENME